MTSTQRYGQHRIALSGDRSRRSAADVVIALASVAFLFLPAAAFVAGARARHFENRALSPAPNISEGWSFFAQLPPWTSDRLPLRQEAVRAAGAIDEHVFGDPALVGTSSIHGGYPDVVFGKDGFWFYGADFKSKCQPRLPVSSIVAKLTALDVAVRSSGRVLVVVSPPDKSTMMPEKLPDRVQGEQCAATTSAAFWADMAAIPSFIDLRTDLRAAAATWPWPLYPAKDTHWDGAGSAVMVRRIVQQLNPAVDASFVQRPAAQQHGVADLAILLGRTDREVFHLLTLANPAVVPDATRFTQPSQDPARYRSTGPPGTLIDSPTLLLGDSFTSASASALRGVFADLTVLSASTASLHPRPVIDSMVAAKFVIVEIVERDMASGAVALLNPDLMARLSAQLAANHWKR